MENIYILFFKSKIGFIVTIFNIRNRRIYVKIIKCVILETLVIKGFKIKGQIMNVMLYYSQN